MKSSTRNPPNLPVLRADKRFEALVKKQEGEHQHVIAGHNKEMQTLRDTLLSASQKFDSLWGKYEQELKDLKVDTICHFVRIKEKLADDQSKISEQKRTIEDLNKQLQDFHVIYSSKEDVEKLKKHMDSRMNDAGVSHLICIQELQRELKSLLSLLKEDFKKSKSDTENKFNELIDKIESNFNVTRIDRVGVLKEIRIYEKTIFIIEKKIENIYTLIERVNEKRGELCHKPE